MKKVFATVVLVLILFTFAACAQQSNDGVYSITYTGRTENLLDAPDSARAGDAVEVKTVLLDDADTEIYVNGKKIEKTHFYDYWGYTFTMPARNVTVEIKPYGKKSEQ